MLGLPHRQRHLASCLISLAWPLASRYLARGTCRAGHPRLLRRPPSSSDCRWLDSVSRHDSRSKTDGPMLRCIWQSIFERPWVGTCARRLDPTVPRFDVAQSIRVD
ncbi:hypothetical protein BD289DRAFT_276301 [Coniella lustricola]|uniref:Uncharacterized protein n=1 Tax=Coniella lustricola TaxID=2025994 RepID=A0A2T3A6J8_9PEZI|nr:hypothetical protein BD289DRAFT_276301 [Coniella lustricola]